MGTFEIPCSACGCSSGVGRWSGDGESEALCMPCASSALAHGHKHCHDEPEDCRSTWTGPLGVTLQLDCPSASHGGWRSGVRS